MLERLPRLLLHAEGLAAFAAAIGLYFRADYQWWLLLALVLAPDLSMIGYAAGTRVGAAAYNTFTLMYRRSFSALRACSPRAAWPRSSR